MGDGIPLVFVCPGGKEWGGSISMSFQHALRTFLTTTLSWYLEKQKVSGGVHTAASTIM